MQTATVLERRLQWIGRAQYISPSQHPAVCIVSCGGFADLQASMLDSLPINGDVSFIRITHEPKRSLHALSSNHFADSNVVVIIANGRESEASDLVATAAFAARAAHAYVLVLYMMGDEDRQKDAGINKIKKAAHAVALVPLSVQATAIRHIINAYLFVCADKQRNALDAPRGADFADLRPVLDASDYTSVSTAHATGKDRAKQATTDAVKHVVAKLKTRRRPSGFFIIVAATGPMLIEEIGAAIAMASDALGSQIPGEIVAHYDEFIEPNTMRVTLTVACVDHV